MLGPRVLPWTARASLRLASRWPRLCCKAAGCRGVEWGHVTVSLRGPRLQPWARASLCLVQGWRGLCISALGRATASSPVRAVYRSARASLCPLYSSCPSWNNAAGAVVCSRLSTASAKGPRKSILPAWAFPLPVTLSPLSCHYSASRAPLRIPAALCDNARRTMPQTVTIADAARILGLHRRTVERRISSGELTAVTTAGRRMVVLEDTPTSEPLPQSSATPPRHADGSAADNAALVEELRARVADLQEERDHWRQTAADLSRNLSEVTGTLYALRGAGAQVETRTLAAETPVHMPAPTHTTVTPPRRRWTLRALYEAWRGVR